MENTSKGLLIAASVLIVIILVTVGIKVLNPSQDVLDESQKVGSAIESSTVDAIDKLQSAMITSKWTQSGTTIKNGDTIIKIGDYVNYKSEPSGKELKWRVLGINSKGQLELISTKQTKEKLVLSGENGWINAETELNKKCDELYGNGTNATGARNLKVEDINKIKGITDLSTINKNYGIKWQYRYTSEGEFQYKKYESNGEIDWKKAPYHYGKFKQPGSNKLLNETNSGESEILTNGEYSYTIGINGLADLFMCDEAYWLASPFIYCFPQGASWGVRRVFNTTLLGYHYLYNSDGTNSNPSYAMRPVVSLKSEVQLVKNSNGTWDFV